MANPDRLSGLDSSFLHLERDSAHMHVGACALFLGSPPRYDELLEAVALRLHLVPRYRQRLALVPLEQGRPLWVDDPHFKLRYHLRHTALARPGGEQELSVLTGRIFSQALDRARPLWELYLVEGFGEDGFALISKTHHALVDGVTGVDLASVLFDPSPNAPSVSPPLKPWLPRPVPSGAQLLADALLERATVPGEIVRGVRAALRGPKALAGRVGEGLAGAGAVARAGLAGAPPSPLNVPIGPHRRFTWVQAELADFKLVKEALGGTVNDAVLAVVAGALGRYLRLHHHPTEDLVLRAMVPVSVQADVELGALGHRVTPMSAPLPVGVRDPAARLALVSEAMRDLRSSGQASGAQVLTQLSGFAPPTIMAQAARLQVRQRMFNLVVTNVPGPQVPLYLLGRELDALLPMVPLSANTALGVAVMSLNGRLSFGLLSDYDALADLDVLAEELRSAISELVGTAYTALGERQPSAARHRTPVRDA